MAGTTEKTSRYILLDKHWLNGQRLEKGTSIALTPTQAKALQNKVQKAEGSVNEDEVFQNKVDSDVALNNDKSKQELILENQKLERDLRNAHKDMAKQEKELKRRQDEIDNMKGELARLTNQKKREESEKK